MTPDPAAIARHREALRRVVVEHPELTVQEAYAAAQEALAGTLSRGSADRIRELLAELYTPAESELWLSSPQRLLADCKPLDLMREGRGGEVERVLRQILEGAYS